MSKELPCTQVMGWMFVNNKVFVHNEPTRKVAAPECTPPVYQQIELIYMYRKVLLSALEHKCQRNRLIRFLLRPRYKEENQTIFSPSGCWTPNIEWQILMQSDKSQCLRAQYIYHSFLTQRRSGPPSRAGIQPLELTFALGLKIKSTNICLGLPVYQALVRMQGNTTRSQLSADLPGRGAANGKNQGIDDFNSLRGWKRFKRLVMNGISSVLLLKRFRAS